MDTGYHSTSELAKIIFNFSNNTSLKLSYLGGQSTVGNGDVNAYDTSQVGTTGLPAFTFEPCGTAGAALTCNPSATGAGTPTTARPRPAPHAARRFRSISVRLTASATRTSSRTSFKASSARRLARRERCSRDTTRVR